MFRFILLVLIGLLHQCMDPNFKVAVIKIDASASKLEGFTKVANITSYKSVKYDTNTLTLNKYYGIGIGIVIPLKEGQFSSKIIIEHDYMNNTQEVPTRRSGSKSSSTIRGYVDLKRCTECNTWFEDDEDLREYNSAMSQQSKLVLFFL